MKDRGIARIARGVWIPAVIWEDRGLSWFQKCLWAEIYAIGSDGNPCKASNECLAERLGSTGPSIANAISKLAKLGFLKRVSFDGRTRGLLASIPVTEQF